MKSHEIEEGWNEVRENKVLYADYDPINAVTFDVIGACFEVHNYLGRGFSEAVYKDALVLELEARGILYERERKFEINYKGTVLPHYYFADFVIENKIILEVKAQQGIINTHANQLINYLAVSGCKIGLLINFGEQSLKYKRFIL
ncbi:MAG: GxxExxY protein [Bacteroidia bacterium]